jgi:CHAT domain-containing protein
MKRKSYFGIKYFHCWLSILTLIFTIFVSTITSLPVLSRTVLVATQSQSIEQSTIQSPQTVPLLQQGRSHYEAGRFTEAATLWQTAARQYQQQGDRLNQALALNYLSLAQQELGQWQQAEEAIAQSLDLLQHLPLTTPSERLILAKALNTQGKLQLAKGQAEAALATWRQATEMYTQANDETGVLGSQINQAQALQTLGLYHQAQAMLERVNQALQQQPDSLLKAMGLQNLGTILQATGDGQQSRRLLEQSLAITQQVGSALDVSKTLLTLGNTLTGLGDSDAALKVYQQAAEWAPTAIARLEAQVNQFRLLIDTKQWTLAQSLFRQLYPDLRALSASRIGIYLRVNLAASLIEMDDEQLALLLPAQEIATFLMEAVQQARDLHDARAESYALGQLGELYEHAQQWREAQTLTQQALFIAQAIDATDIVYRWQWQLGRLRQQQGDKAGAIAAYSEAIDSLQAVRQDLLAVSTDVQFSFRKRIEPVYRELVELLVQSDHPDQQILEQARRVIESLQQAELENFFRSACLDTYPTDIDQLDPSAAIIYPIVLSDRLAIIFSVPGQPLQLYNTMQPSSVIEDVAQQFFQSLNPIFSDRERLQLSQKLYDWLIRPLESNLVQAQISTLVFVPDGVLRNLPMSALYDGQHYLVETYNIAIAPSLQLLKTRSLAPKQLQALVGGLTESRQGFAALPGVARESSEISSTLNSKVLLDQNFTQGNLQKQIRETSFPLVHLATHGQFSSNAGDTFILTWNDRITIDGLRTLLQSRAEPGKNPIELLVLSACETAEGDQRATLGLAGLAVRSGARSTLATLWAVNDTSTAEFMVNFYQALTHQGKHKAEALRQAQLKFLQNPSYNHPFYWAPFILVGNWL